MIVKGAIPYHVYGMVNTIDCNDNHEGRIGSYDNNGGAFTVVLVAAITIPFTIATMTRVYTY